MIAPAPLTVEDRATELQAALRESGFNYEALTGAIRAARGALKSHAKLVGESALIHKAIVNLLSDESQKKLFEAPDPGDWLNVIRMELGRMDATLPEIPPPPAPQAVSADPAEFAEVLEYNTAFCMKQFKQSEKYFAMLGSLDKQPKLMQAGYVEIPDETPGALLEATAKDHIFTAAIRNVLIDAENRHIGNEIAGWGQNPAGLAGLISAKLAEMEVWVGNGHSMHDDMTHWTEKVLDTPGGRFPQK